MVSEGEELTFWGHLDVLRKMLLRAGSVLLFCMVAIFCIMPEIFDSFILGPARADFFLYRWIDSFASGFSFIPDFDENFKVDLININLASQFITHISTSFWMAIVIGFPYFIYELWRFVRPALYPRELKNVRRAFLFGTVLFYAGCVIGYCIVFPLTFRFLADYQIGHIVVNQINLSSYIGNFISIIFVMGLVFELPLLAWLLSCLNIINRDFLKQYRKHAVVILLVLAAVITPSGDPFTLMVVFFPLYLLYELSVRIVKKNEGKTP